MPRRKKPQTWREIRNATLWPMLQLAGLAFFAYLNASHFDATELKMLAEYAAFWKILSTIQSKVG